VLKPRPADSWIFNRTYHARLSISVRREGGTILSPWPTVLLLALESSAAIRLRISKLAGGGVGAQYEAHLIVSETGDAEIEVTESLASGAAVTKVIDRFGNKLRLVPSAFLQKATGRWPLQRPPLPRTVTAHVLPLSVLFPASPLTDRNASFPSELWTTTVPNRFSARTRKARRATLHGRRLFGQRQISS
jgi:hypothetical protein